MMRGGNAGQPATVTTTSTGTGDRSGWVLILGGGLIVINFVFGSGNAAVRYIGGQGQLPHGLKWGEYALEAVMLLVLFGISKTGEAGSNFAVIFLVAVWVLWLLNNPNAIAHLLGQAPNETPGPPPIKDKKPPAVKPPSKPSKGPF